MTTTLKISDAVAHKIMRLFGRPLSDVEMCRSIASVVDEATATQQAECERLTKELATGLEMIASLHTNAAQWKSDAAHWQRRGDSEMALRVAAEERSAHLAATCEALRKELAEARKDTERLDWIVEQGSDIFYGDNDTYDYVDMDQWEREGGNDDAPAIKKAYRAMLDAAAAQFAVHSSPESQGKAGT